MFREAIFIGIEAYSGVGEGLEKSNLRIDLKRVHKFVMMVYL
jgi:hypothetical protein